MKKFVYFFLPVLLLSSCSILQNASKRELADGKYKLKTEGKKYNCYLQNKDDRITIYELPNKILDSLPREMEIYPPAKQRLIKLSLDKDILTALFKIRPSTQNLPTQLNTNFNANIYLGLRTDIYRIHYKKNPLDIYERQINHFGFSGGFFLGIGNTTMNTSTTNNAIESEYDGFVLQKGVAGILAINKLTIGLSLGFDSLLDKNNKTWIYENKPWFGIMLGLNLN